MIYFLILGEFLWFLIVEFLWFLIVLYLQAGGSSGTVFAWDLRWQQQPIILSGVGMGEVATHSPCESEVWEVKYDPYVQTSNFGNMSSSRILPAMLCSEDGILAVVEQGMELFCICLYRFVLHFWSGKWKFFKHINWTAQFYIYYSMCRWETD